MAEKPTSASTTAPKPAKPLEKNKAEAEEDKLNPTRFGDWEKNGRCIDF